MLHKHFALVGIIGPEPDSSGSTLPKVQEALFAAFGAQFELQRKWEQARAGYVSWLNAQPEDAFAPATHAEILAQYDANCAPGNPTLTVAPLAKVPAQADTLDQANLLENVRVEQLASSATEYKALAAYHFGDIWTRYIALTSAKDSTPGQILYDGVSLALAIDCYNRGAPLPVAVPMEGTSIAERIAQSESNPVRKAALDRARIRRSLANLWLKKIGELSPEQAIEALCETPEGKAQYEHIRTRAPGSQYKALGPRDDGISPEELIAGLATTPELVAEFEEASREVRQGMGLEGGHTVLQSLATAVRQLLWDAYSTLSEGLESDGAFEAEWSIADKALVHEILAVINDNMLENEPNNADIQNALELLVKARESLAGGLESESSLEAEWSQEDRKLVARIDAVLANVHAKELLGPSKN